MQSGSIKERQHCIKGNAGHFVPRYHLWPRRDSPMLELWRIVQRRCRGMPWKLRWRVSAWRLCSQIRVGTSSSREDASDVIVGDGRTSERADVTVCVAEDLRHHACADVTYTFAHHCAHESTTLLATSMLKM